MTNTVCEAESLNCNWGEGKKEGENEQYTLSATVYDKCKYLF